MPAICFWPQYDKKYSKQNLESPESWKLVLLSFLSVVYLSSWKSQQPLKISSPDALSIFCQRHPPHPSCLTSHKNGHDWTEYYDYHGTIHIKLVKLVRFETCMHVDSFTTLCCAGGVSVASKNRWNSHRSGKYTIHCDWGILNWYLEQGTVSI